MLHVENIAKSLTRSKREEGDTVRELYRFVSGAASYQAYQTYEGLWIPTKMPVRSNLKKEGLLHEMRVLDVTFGEVAAEAMRPKSERVVMGDKKE